MLTNVNVIKSLRMYCTYFQNSTKSIKICEIFLLIFLMQKSFCAAKIFKQIHKTVAEL